MITFMEVIWMINLSDKQKDFKEMILKLEKENIVIINKLDDKQLVAKIIRLYEEMIKNDNK